MYNFKFAIVQPDVKYPKVVSYDIDKFQPNARIQIEGLSYGDMHIVEIDKHRQLIYIKCEGYTAYISGGVSKYTPAMFRVFNYEMRNVPDSNEVHVYTDSMFGIAQLPINWKPTPDATSS